MQSNIKGLERCDELQIFKCSLNSQSFDNMPDYSGGNVECCHVLLLGLSELTSKKKTTQIISLLCLTKLRIMTAFFKAQPSPHWYRPQGGMRDLSDYAEKNHKTSQQVSIMCNVLVVK